MFRPMRRCGQQLKLNECIEILKAEPEECSLFWEITDIRTVSPWITGTANKTANSIFTVQKMAIKLIPYRAVIRFPIVYMTKASVKKENGL